MMGVEKEWNRDQGYVAETRGTHKYRRWDVWVVPKKQNFYKKKEYALNKAIMMHRIFSCYHV